MVLVNPYQSSLHHVEQFQTRDWSVYRHLQLVSHVVHHDSVSLLVGSNVQDVVIRFTYFFLIP